MFNCNYMYLCSPLLSPHILSLSLYMSVSTITKVYTVEELVNTQALGQESSFSGILYAVLMSINIDGDPTRVVTTRW